jgi:hypothetical protein
VPSQAFALEFVNAPTGISLVIIPVSPAAEKADMLLAHICRFAGLLALPALVSLFAPVTAWCDIYKWTDAEGKIVISDTPPSEPNKVRNFTLVLKEKERAVQTPAPPAQRVATRTEQVLLDRVESLERQLKAQQSPPPAQPAPPAADYQVNSSAPPPPPSDYYSSYDAGYYYVRPPLYPYVVYRAVSRPRPVHHTHSGAFRGGGSVHTARR